MKLIQLLTVYIYTGFDSCLSKVNYETVVSSDET